MAGIQRLSANDLTTLATDRGQVPMNICAVLLLGGQGDPGRSAQVVAQRLATVGRMRQRLNRAPLGAGRPYWSDDPRFRLSNHVARLEARDEQGLLGAAAEVVCQRLPMHRPLWAMRWCGLTDGRLGIVLVVHHVLADGMGGLAMLASLVDGIEGAPVVATPAPTSSELRHDAARSRREAFGHVGRGLRAAAAGLRELGVDGRPRFVEPTSITGATSSSRVVAVVGVPLAPVVEFSHQRGVTVNDLVLRAVCQALFDLLDARGERPPELVVSVPISMRGAGDDLGNQVGAVPVAVPYGLDAEEQLSHIAARTRAAKQGSRGSSSMILSWVFRGLGALHLAQFFVDRQRLVHTFETNLRGPGQQVHIDGRPLERIVPIAVNPGNVGVSFDVLSYAGELTLSVVADPTQVPEAESLARTLEVALTRL